MKSARLARCASLRVASFSLATLVACLGCDRPADVVIYTSVDQQFAEQAIKKFESDSGLKVAAVFDTEAGKTTGLLRRLEREAPAPRCDVWWSSEIFGTIELARRGIFEKYDSPAAADIPAEWKDRDARWTACAARARVLAFHPDRIRASDLPKTWREIVERDWKTRLAVANPLFGTTRGHLAAMFAYWGEEPAQEMLRRWADGGARLADGNSQAVALLVAGQVDVAMTDTDDVWVAQARGARIDLIYPALDDKSPAVWIPCSVGVVAGAPHPAAARKLMDFLVSAQVEELLARSDSKNVPVRKAVRKICGMSEMQPAAIDFERVTDALKISGEAARSTLLR
ncbi:MAG: extracellular solute-binding protein [Phycisphaerales bacterium]|nr:extracellular solute-binding protein [Phycisphaerales bacterium]